MRALDRKLLRDLWQMKGQAIAIALVMACGIVTFVMSLSTFGSLERNLTTYYDRYRFAQVFGHVKRAPNTLAARFAEIPGVAQVQARIVVDVTLDVPGLVEPAGGRLISVPERRAPGLNDLYLRSGRHIEPGRGEVLANEAFVKEHKFQPGDSVVAVINGRKQRLKIVGVVLSPEFIYLIRPGDILPDDKRFGVFWMGYQELAAAFNMEGAFNDVALTLTPDAIERDVLQRLDRLIEPYGGTGSYGRGDHLSHQLLMNELRQLQTMAVMAPLIFLGVAAFLLQVVLNRQIGTQREQIAALKAFGYTKFEVGLHYLKLVLLIASLGAVLGLGVGAWLGRALTGLYAVFYHFPTFDYYLDLGTVLWAVLIGVGSAIVGTLSAVRRAIRLPPAEAMRPEPPATFRPTVVERMGLQRLLSPATRMILRQLERRPLKALMSCLGIALAAAILVMGNFMGDSLDYIIELQFMTAQRQDMTISFVEPQSVEALYEVQHLPGVRHCEPTRGLGVRVRHEHRSRRIGIQGMAPEPVLNRLVDMEGRVVPLPPDGLVISQKLAELLAVNVGDTLTVEVMEGERPVREVRVAGLLNDMIGIAGFMDIRAVNRLVREGPVVTGAYLAVDPRHTDELYRTLKESPRVAGVLIKKAALASFESTIAENMLRIKMFNVVFACIIAFGVVYNTARIALAERSRELASLRVMGFTRAEISGILLGELAVLVLAALPAGLLIGYGLAALTVLANDAELFRVPLFIRPSTYAFATTVVLLAAAASALVVRRGLDRLDLVAVLKSRE